MDGLRVVTAIRGRVTGQGRGPVLPARPAWHDLAACSGSQDPLFFPKHESEQAAKEAQVKYCDRCPVWAECLGSALRKNDLGIFAGMTTTQRKSLLRTRTRVKCPRCQCPTLVSLDRHDICTACGVSWKTERRPVTLEQSTTDGDDDR